MKLLLVLVAVVYVCYGSTTTAKPEASPKPADSAINEVADKSELHDGINLSTLTNEQLEQLANAEDEEFIGELGTSVTGTDYDIWGFKTSLRQTSRRPKRWIGAVLSIGRALLGGAIRRGVTRSGARLTRHYQKSGGYRNAVKDFNRIRPQNTRAFKGNNGLRGQTGTVGRHRVTVRNSSSNGSPTLEIRSPKRGGGTTVRKIRYPN